MGAPFYFSEDNNFSCFLLFFLSFIFPLFCSHLCLCVEGFPQTSGESWLSVCNEDQDIGCGLQTLECGERVEGTCLLGGPHSGYLNGKSAVSLEESPNHYLLVVFLMLLS